MEDLTQVVLLRVLEIHRQQGAIRSRSYLAQAAYSVLVDEMRRLMKKPETSLDAMEPDILERGAAGRTVPPPDELRGLGDGIRACLEHLKDGRRHAVTLYLQGFTAEEAQRTLGWGLKKIRNLTYRGMADLRACLHSKGFSDEA
jgi:RNA polymerase sigma-70 factor (ECF subfamily)